jgi:hypothetical protein
VTHGNTVVDGDGVELSGEATEAFNLGFYLLTDFVEVGMTGHELSKRVNDGDNGTAELAVFHTIGTPKCASAGHTSAGHCSCTT